MSFYKHCALIITSMLLSQSAYLLQHACHKTLHCEDEGTQVLRNVGILPHHHTLQARHPWLKSSSPWKPQTLHFICFFITSNISFSAVTVALHYSLWKDMKNESTLLLENYQRTGSQLTVFWYVRIILCLHTRHICFKVKEILFSDRPYIYLLFLFTIPTSGAHSRVGLMHVFNTFGTPLTELSNRK